MGRFDGFLICSDLDGTLLPEDRKIPPANLEVLKIFTGEGGRFTVCTGRTQAGYRSLQGVLPVNAPVILANGAMIYDYAGDTLLRSACLPEEAGALCREATERFPLASLEVQGGDAIYLYKPNWYALEHMRYICVEASEVAEIRDIPLPWLKALFVGPNAVLTEMESWLKARYGDLVEVFFSFPTLLEIVAREAGKGAGAAWLADHLGIAHDRVFTVGDYDNDLSMLTRFHSFAPMDAAPHIRASATHVTCPCREGVLRDVLAHLEALV